MNELSFSNLLNIFKKSLIYIIVVSMLCGIGAYLYCKFVATPTYQARVSFIATNGGLNTDENVIAENTASGVSSENKISGADFSASKYLLDTYIGLFKTRELYAMVKEKSNLDYTPGQIKSMVKVARRSDDDLFIDFTVTSVNPEHAVTIADTLHDIGDDYISTFFPASYVMAVEDSAGRAVQNYPVTATTTIIYAFLGGVLVFAAAVVITLMDKTIKGEKDFADNYDIPILGNIPNFKAATREENK